MLRPRLSRALVGQAALQPQVQQPVQPQEQPQVQPFVHLSKQRGSMQAAHSYQPKFWGRFVAHQNKSLDESRPVCR